MRRLARPALGVAVLAAVLLAVDPRAVAEELVGANPLLILAGVGGLTATHAIAAATWRRLVDRLSGVQLAWRSVVAQFYAAQAIGGVTPGNLGGDLHRVIAVRAGGHGASASVAPVVMQRATSLAALALLGLAALGPIGDAPAAVPFVTIGFAVAASLAISLAALTLPRGGAVGRLRYRFARIIGLGGTSSIRSAAPARRLLAVAAFDGIGLGIAFHLAAIGCTWLLVAAVEPGLLTLPLLAALTISRLSIAIPITPSGIGLQEGAIAILATQIGIPPEPVLAGMLLARVSLLATSLIGAVVLIRGKAAGIAPRARVPNAATPGTRT